MMPIQCVDGTTVVPWACPPREEDIKSLETDTFDVLVVGGGCVGAGVALDAATRGLKVALVERDDFASGTSSRSTKLVHGGIRYLEEAFKSLDKESYHLVNEALAERAHMLDAAPFMVKPLPIMIPIYKLWQVPYMWVGAKAYDFVAGSQRRVPASRFISKEEALFQFPMLKADGLKGAVVYYDAQQNDSRMNVLLVLTAAQKGATVANYVNVRNLTKGSDGKINGAGVTDLTTGRSWNIKARTVVNATGPWADGLRLFDNPEAEKLLLPAAGVHIILPDHFSPDRMGLIVPETKDGRVLFFLPWEGSTICGTTDSASELTMLPKPTEEEVHFILEESNRFLSRKVSRSDVRAAWSGIRPLVKDPKAVSGTSKVSRKHVLEVSDSGLVSIMGGKWTTYRQMAEDAVDQVVPLLPSTSTSNLSECSTKGLQVVGGDRAGLVVKRMFDRITVTLREHYGIPKDIALHLVSNYGTRALQIAEMQLADPSLSRRVVRRYPIVFAEALFAVEQEYALTLVDIIARRTRLAFLDAPAAQEVLPELAGIVGKRLGWSKKQVQAEIDAATEFLKTMV